MKYKKGDFVVLLSSWVQKECYVVSPASCYSFVEGMDLFLNHVGIVKEICSNHSMCEQLSVHFFEFNDSAYICPKVVRMATEEECRVAKFLYRIKREVPVGNKKK